MTQTSPFHTGNQDADLFLQNNPGLDITQFDFLDEQALDALNWSGADRTKTVDLLMTWQRLLRVTPEVAEVSVLLEHGITSAQQISAVSQSQFVATYAPLLGDGGADRAKDIYLRASAVQDKAMHLLATIHSTTASRYFSSMPVNHVSDQLTGYFESISGYDQLFGSLDFCECDECKSIFGAAAYFVDLMRIIDKAVTGPNTHRADAKDNIPADLTLPSRRPDLFNIALTCENTNTLVPYLQIVNEILENTVIQQLQQDDPGRPVNTFQKLATSNYPFNLPYHLPLDQVRSSLAQLKTGLPDIISAYDPAGKNPLALALEILQLSYESYKLLTTAAADSASLSASFGTNVPLPALGGLDRVTTLLNQTGLSRDQLTSLLYQNLSQAELKGSTLVYTTTEWGTKMVLTFEGDQVTGSFDYRNGKIEGVLNGQVLTGVWAEGSYQAPHDAGNIELTFTPDRSGFTGRWMLGYNGSWEAAPWNGVANQDGSTAGNPVAHRFFINQNLPAAKYLDIVVNSTNPDQPFEQVVNLDAPALDQVNRFIRLSQTLGWTYADLDRVLLSTGTAEINDSVLITLSKVKLLSAQYNIPVTTLASFWFDINTTGAGSAGDSQADFDTIFNAPALIRQAKEHVYYHPRTTVSTQGGDALYDNPLYQDSLVPFIINQPLAAAWLATKTGDELESLQAALTLGRRVVSGIRATLDELMAIGQNFFGKDTAMISLGVTNLSILYRHAAFPALLGMKVAEYLLLLKLLGRQNAASLTADDIGVIADAADWLKSSGFTVYDLDYIINAQESTFVNTFYNKNNLPGFLQSLGVLLQPVLLSDKSFSGNDIDAVLSPAIFGQLVSKGYMSTAGVVQKTFTTATLTDIAAITINKGSSQELVVNTTAAQQLYVSNKLADQQQEQQKKLADAVAAFFGSKTPLVTVIMNGVAATQKVPNTLLLLVSIPGFDGTAGTIPAAVQNFITGLSQYIIIAQRLQLSAEEADHVFTCSAAYATGSQDKPGLMFEYVSSIWKMKQLVKGFQDNNNDLLAYLASVNQKLVPALPDPMKALQKLSGWDAASCSYLCKILFADTGACTTVENIYQLKSCFDISKAAGIDVYFLDSLRQLPRLPVSDVNWKLYTDTANTLLGSLNARYGSEQWDDVYKRYNQPVMEHKRDVLTGFSIWKLGKKYSDITNTRSLYEFLLVDVDMCGCSEISYIKLALNSAQLYLQRCRLNLERNVTISTDDIPGNWWQWMMNYRVWEANRKVFLYPENYIDPSLRKTKTTLFKQLESTLMQAEINKDNVEIAYMKYLDDFAQLSKLQYCDGYHCSVHDAAQGDIDTLFLFAHTQEQPYNFYYISREGKDTWSEWSKIDITINSEYITPVYAFNRLFLFWVEVKKQNESSSAGSAAKNTLYKASIKYSFHNFNGNWVQPQTLVEEMIAYNTPNAYLGQLQTNNAQVNADLFDMNSLYWNKVYIVHVGSGNYTIEPVGTGKEDKISIFYGPFLEKNSSTARLSVNMPTTDPSIPDQYKFENSLYNGLKRFNVLSDEKVKGHLPMYGGITMNINFDTDFLLKRSEFLTLDLVSPVDSRITYRPVIDPSSYKLYISPSPTPIYDNYFADGVSPYYDAIKPPSRIIKTSFSAGITGISAATSGQIYNDLLAHGDIDNNGNVSVYFTSDTICPDLGDYLQPLQVKQVAGVLYKAMGDRAVFSKTSHSNAKVITIKNQPNWFIFDNGDEAFLITPNEDNTPKISENLRVDKAKPAFDNGSFVAGDINANTSQQVLRDLAGNGYVDNNGQLDPAFTFEQDLSGIIDYLNDDQMSMVKNILLNSPVVQKEIFKPSISDGTGDQILRDLRAGGYLDSQNRLIPYFTEETDLTDILSGYLSSRQIAFVKKQILDLPVSTFLEYGAGPKAPAVSDVHDYALKAQRLTTASIHRLSQKLFAGGIDALLSLESQSLPVTPGIPFSRFQAGTNLQYPDTTDGSQVDFTGPFGNYYWELFFHGPMLVASMLKSNQQFEDAQKWYQYIFNPTVAPLFIRKDSFVTETINANTSAQVFNDLRTAGIIDGQGFVDTWFDSPATLSDDLTYLGGDQVITVANVLFNHQLSTPAARYWQFMPFRNHHLESLKDQLTNSSEIAAYEDDPFDPHAIARLRIGAYEKTMVMQYIDNLLAWGDYMFSQYTWEAITTATMLYVYAYDLLGPRPQKLGTAASAPPATFADIKNRYATDSGGIPPFYIMLENVVAGAGVSSIAAPLRGMPFNDLGTYFCVPENDQFTTYWDRVEDRLYKIRHCLNIQGISQPLALFEPPIDPMQLVKAAASGSSVLDVLSQLQQPVPYYRFSYTLERARYFTQTLIQLGASLWAALEKSDSEALELLRSTHGIDLLNLTTSTREQAIDELKQTLASMQQNLAAAQHRYDHYTALLASGNIDEETTNINHLNDALPAVYTAIGIRGVTVVGYLAANIFGFADGGMKFGDAINAGAQISDSVATIYNQRASIVNTQAQYKRRDEDWQFQKDSAQYEIDQINNQIAATNIRIAITSQELAIHKKTIAQAGEVDNFLRSKFTSRDLYQWMMGRVSSLYFQMYKLALDVALRAQAAYQLELNRTDTFINFGYWDSLHKGLLAGESLLFSLNQMEKSYMDNNGRTLEIEKTMSLMQLFPQDFLNFKWGINGAKKGEFTFTLNEKLFDFDFPGHYGRQIKSVSITIPAIVGPYRNINATLVQTTNTILLKPSEAAVKHLIDPTANPDVPDGSLRQNWVPSQQVAISRAVDDAGLFTLDFRDERYMPFEGTGAVSSWIFSMPPETNRINFESISDVIVKVRYTAYDGGITFRQQVQQALRASTSPYPYRYAKCFDLKQAFSAAWNQLVSAPPVQGVQQITFVVTDNVMLPNLQDVNLETISVYLKTAAGNDVSGSDFLKLAVGTNTAIPITVDNNLGELSQLQSLTGSLTDVAWSLQFGPGKIPDVLLNDNNVLDADNLLDIAVVITYSANAFSAA